MLVEQTPGGEINELNGVSTPVGSKVIATATQVKTAVQRLAQEIAPWIDSDPDHQVVLVALLKGGKFFCDRLSEALIPLCSADFSRFDVKISTRDEVGRPLNAPTIQGNLTQLEGRRVLLVDDILDSGMTLRLMLEHLRPHAIELRSSVLVQKDSPLITSDQLAARPNADYVGLRFADPRWFSGCGMDMPNDPMERARDAEFIIAYPPLA